MSARCDLLGSTSSSMLADADAELIATCAAFCDLERAYDAPGYGQEIDSPEYDAVQAERERIVAEQEPLVDRMCELPCTTLAGVQAMAKALAAWDRELLKDAPARDVGDRITSNMVDRLLALRVPDRHPDADLLAVCAEFQASETAYNAIYDDPGADDEACDALANPIAERWDGMLDQMAQLRATTSDGLAARALTLAQHSGIKPGTTSYPFAFAPNQPTGGVTGRLLHMLLTDAGAMGGAPPPSPDAAILSLRDEFRAAVALWIEINHRTDEILDEEMDSASYRLNDACSAIVDSPPAQIQAGRALKAAAAMHQLTAAFNEGCADDWSGIGEEMAWHVLSEIAGDEYVPTLPERWAPPRRATLTCPDG